MKINNEIELIFLKENRGLGTASEHGDLRDALEACIRRYERRQLLKNVDELMLGGLVRNMHRRWSKSAAVNRRIDSTPRGDQV